MVELSDSKQHSYYKVLPSAKSNKNQNSFKVTKITITNSLNKITTSIPLYRKYGFSIIVLAECQSKYIVSTRQALVCSNVPKLSPSSKMALHFTQIVFRIFGCSLAISEHVLISIL